MKKFFVLLGVLLLTACGSSGSDSGGDDVHRSTVQYTVNDSGCLTEAKDYDDSHVYTSGTYKSIDYIWQCTTYKGQSGLYVSLDFDNSSDGTGCLKFDTEYISSGICY